MSKVTIVFAENSRVGLVDSLEDRAEARLRGRRPRLTTGAIDALQHAAKEYEKKVELLSIAVASGSQLEHVAPVHVDQARVLMRVSGESQSGLRSVLGGVMVGQVFTNLAPIINGDYGVVTMSSLVLFVVGTLMIGPEVSAVSLRSLRSIRLSWN